MAAPPPAARQPDEIEKDMVFKRDSVKITLEMLNRIGRTFPHRDTAVAHITEFLSVLLELKPREPLQRELSFRAYPCLLAPADSPRRWMISRKMATAFHMFYQIWQTIDALLSAQPPTNQFDGGIEGARGISFAVALGHISEASLRPNFAQDAVIEGIPTAFVSGRHNPGLEALFEGLGELPLPNLDALKHAVHTFGKLCQALIADDLTVNLIEAFKIDEPDKYRALTLELLSDGVFYSGTTEPLEATIVLHLQIQIPRGLRTRRPMRLLCPSDLGPIVAWQSAIKDQQTALITGRNGIIAKASKRATDRSSIGDRTLEFRLSPRGVEFRGPGTNIMLRC
jgi:hypothetical protein